MQINLTQIGRCEAADLFGLTFGTGVHACLGRDLDGGAIGKGGMDPATHQYGMVTLLAAVLLEEGARPDSILLPCPDSTLNVRTGEITRGDWSMKTWIVTGAGAGIGEAIARAATASGDAVMILDISAERAEAVAASLRGARAFAVNAADEAGIEAVLGQMRVVPDVLVNNAGIVRFGPLLDQSLADMKAVVNVNLIGTYVTARAVARQMIARGWASSST